MTRICLTAAAFPVSTLTAVFSQTDFGMARLTSQEFCLILVKLCTGRQTGWILRGYDARGQHESNKRGRDSERFLAQWNCGRKMSVHFAMDWD